MNLLMLIVGIFTVMVPGFLSSLIVFPRPADLDFWKRVAVSFGLGTLVLAYLGFALARAGLLLIRPFFAGLLISCGVLGFLAFVRGGLSVISYYLRYLPLFKPKPVVLACPQCAATFTNQKELESHIASKHTAPPKAEAKPTPSVLAPPRFTCPRCGTVLETREGLQAHLAVCRVKICSYCGSPNPSDAQKCSRCGAWLFA
jgi:uncharacterized C2H2 Zn-finger protein